MGRLGCSTDTVALQAATAGNCRAGRRHRECMTGVSARYPPPPATAGLAAGVTLTPTQTSSHLQAVADKRKPHVLAHVEQAKPEQAEWAGRSWMYDKKQTECATPGAGRAGGA